MWPWFLVLTLQVGVRDFKEQKKILENTYGTSIYLAVQYVTKPNAWNKKAPNFLFKQTARGLIQAETLRYTIWETH